MNATLSVLAVWAALGQHQKAPGVEQVLKPEKTLIEKVEQPGMWIMEEFVFIQPRMITVEVPGKGRKLLWYMLYRVKNKGDSPRLFVPKFRLVDDKANAYLDTIIPKAQRAIQSREDPLQPLENSVTAIGELEPSVEEGIDKALYAVAIWEDVNPRLKSFDILIEGLSNGFKELKDPTTGEPIKDPVTGQTKAQRKTLILKFARPGDEFLPTEGAKFSDVKGVSEREVRYLGYDWIYQ